MTVQLINKYLIANHSLHTHKVNVQEVYVECPVGLVVGIDVMWPVLDQNLDELAKNNTVFVRYDMPTQVKLNGDFETYTALSIIPPDKVVDNNPSDVTADLPFLKTQKFKIGITVTVVGTTLDFLAMRYVGKPLLRKLKARAELAELEIERVEMAKREAIIEKLNNSVIEDSDKLAVSDDMVTISLDDSISSMVSIDLKSRPWVDNALKNEDIEIKKGEDIFNSFELPAKKNPWSSKNWYKSIKDNASDKQVQIRKLFETVQKQKVSASEIVTQPELVILEPELTLAELKEIKIIKVMEELKSERLIREANSKEISDKKELYKQQKLEEANKKLEESNLIEVEAAKKEESVLMDYVNFLNNNTRPAKYEIEMARQREAESINSGNTVFKRTQEFLDQNINTFSIKPEEYQVNFNTLGTRYRNVFTDPKGNYIDYRDLLVKGKPLTINSKLEFVDSNNNILNIASEVYTKNKQKVYFSNVFGDNPQNYELDLINNKYITKTKNGITNSKGQYIDENGAVTDTSGRLLDSNMRYIGENGKPTNIEGLTSIKGVFNKPAFTKAGSNRTVANNISENLKIKANYQIEEAYKKNLFKVKDKIQKEFNRKLNVKIKAATEKQFVVNDSLDSSFESATSQEFNSLVRQEGIIIKNDDQISKQVNDQIENTDEYFSLENSEDGEVINQSPHLEVGQQRIVVKDGLGQSTVKKNSTAKDINNKTELEGSSVVETEELDNIIINDVADAFTKDIL